MRPAIPRLNFQHLLYFWSVVRNGSLTKACAELHLSAPTVSTQLHQFEERLGAKLLMKSGRTLVPTEKGHLVFGYAEEIFSLGADLVNALAQNPTNKPMRLAVGIDDVVPKEIAQRLLNAALDLDRPVQLHCREGTLQSLLNALELRELDVVISDSPVTPSLKLRAYNHHLGGCNVSWMASSALAKSMRKDFPNSLHGTPLLLPTSDTAIRRALDQWLDRHDIRPVIVGEFEDYGLLREFARAGHGVAPVPSILVSQLQKESGLKDLGTAQKVRGEFYAISMERHIRHPAVLALHDKSAELFS
jgi:LysR family transcriptional activator of nhaA